MLTAPAFLGSDGLGYAVTWLGKSPFDPGTFNVLPTNLPADAYYQFAAEITDCSTGDLLGARFGSVFMLDPTTFVDGCPAPGQLVPTG